VCIPNRSTKSAARKKEQKKRWFKQGQKWRTGCEGRISVLKRRHGLRRCLYKGDTGMRRWVGLGVIADNLTHIGKFWRIENSEIRKSRRIKGPHARRPDRRAFCLHLGLVTSQLASPKTEFCARK